MGQAPIAGKQNDAGKNIAAKPTATDQDKLQGKWQIMSLTMQGKVFKREDKLEAWQPTFEKDVTIDGDRLSHAQAASEGKFQLDDTHSPKQITFQDKDGKPTFRGIYAIDGDCVTVCVNGNGTDTRRPETFATKEGTALLLISLKRADARK